MKNTVIENNVPSNYCFTEKDFIDEAYPLEIPFHLDDATNKVSSAMLYYDTKRISEAIGEVVTDFEAPKDFIRIFINGEEKTSISDTKGSVDLTQWITTPGWHELKLYSQAYVEINWQLYIKTFVRW